MKKIFLFILCSCIASTLFAQTWTELGAGNNALHPNNSIMSIAIDHSGKVYAAGSFTNKNGHYIVSKWDGASWGALGVLENIVPTGRNCLAVDSVDNVYVTFRGSMTPNMLMKWNGTNWSYFGPTNSLGTIGPIAVDKNQHLYANRYMQYMGNPHYFAIDKGYAPSNWGLLGYVPVSNFSFAITGFCMAFYTTPTVITIDPSGNVYAGGAFTNNVSDTSRLNPAPLLRVVKWDGMKWSVLNEGQEDLGTIQDLAADQSGNIYAASNSSGRYYVAKWDGTTWAELGTGSNVLNANSGVWTLAVDKSGNVYAAGNFTNADGLRYVAKWDGNSWSELGTGTGSLAANNIIYDVTTDDAGNVYAAGSFTNYSGKSYVAKWSNDETLGVQSKSAAQVVPFYPNPSDGYSQIRVSEDVELTVYSSLGEPIKTMYVHAGTSSIDLTYLTEGLYMLVCRGEITINYAPIKFIKE